MLFILLSNIQTSRVKGKKFSGPKFLQLFGYLNILSILQDLDADESLGVFSTVKVQKVCGHCTKVMTLLEMAFMIGPAAAHSLHHRRGSRSSPYIVSQLTLLPS